MARLAAVAPTAKQEANGVAADGSEAGLYAAGVKSVLLRKIRKAEQELIQLKMDYCRFVYGLSLGALVVSDARLFAVDHVDTDTMRPMDNDEWSRPHLIARRVDELAVSRRQLAAPVELGSDWEIFRPVGRSRRI